MDSDTKVRFSKVVIVLKVNSSKTGFLQLSKANISKANFSVSLLATNFI